MKRALSICWKDLIITLNDRAALVFMLLAPFLLTLGMGLVTGSFSTGSSTGSLEDIPVQIVNLDDGQMGQILVDVIQSENLATLLEPQVVEDATAARQAVEAQEAYVAVVIPAEFTESITSMDAGGSSDAPQVEVYANPTAPISASIVQSIVSEVINQMDTGRVGVAVTINGLMATGRLEPSQIEVFAAEMTDRMAEQQETTSLLTVNANQGEPEEQVNYLAYLAPGMAVVFLMYTVTQGSRSLLVERHLGTLQRMLTTPTRSFEVLGGKLLSIFVTGLLQMVVLVAASGMLFQLDWGSPIAVLVLLVAVVAAATGWGILLASVARSAFQVSSLGTAMMLLFGILGGSFIPTSMFAEPVRWLGKLTPNAWAVDGFTRLAAGGTLTDLVPALLPLLGLTVTLFGLAVLLSRKRWASGFLK